jgi:Mg-chelatase subunit ChlD
VAISFHYPWILLLIPLVLYPVRLWYRSARQMPAGRRKLICALRVGLILCIILSLAGLQLRYKINEQSVVFVVDLSASCEQGKNMAENFIKEALEYKKADDKAAVVVFGENARVDQPLSRDAEIASIESLVDRGHSNIEKGLELADALIPETSQKRLVLFSDYRENMGDLVSEIEFLANKQLRVDLVPLEPAESHESKVESLEIPQKLFAGESFPLKVRIHSNTGGSGLLRIFRDRTLIAEEVVRLSKGENQFVYSSTIEESGFFSFGVTAEFEEDTIAENNEASAFTLVHGPPTVLLVEGEAGEGKTLQAALSSLGLKSKCISPLEIPGSLAELQRYAVIALCNVPAEEIRNEAMEAIHSSVRDLGNGLIMLGGEQSFGPGGYFNTPVEKALPVHMDLRGKAEIPSLGLVMVIDKSGSMSGGQGAYSKIDLAKEAAIQATSILGPLDKIGVIAFDEACQWVVKLQSPDDLQAIQDDIATIRAGGGTNIFPSLALAYSSLKDAECKYKHIILLTDGQSATSGDYYYLARRMENENITMSTVAVGEDADTDLMETLAKWGRGRYYFSEDVSSIPKIFTKETIRALNHYLVEEDFLPVQTAASSVMDGLAAVPELNGYVATSPKDTAAMVLASHRGDPLLAHWQYGLGRSVAFTSDVSGRWSTPWISWQYYNRFWANIISWLLPRTQGSEVLNLQASIEGNHGLIQVESSEYSRILPTTASVVSPSLEKQEIILQPVAPGRYEGRFSSREAGVYMMTVAQDENGQQLRTVSGGVAVPYSPEYSFAGLDEKMLERVLESGGGKILTEPREAFADNLAPVRGALELWPYLLMLALIILPLDIAARRLNIGFSDIKSRKEEIRQKLSGLQEEATDSSSISRLQERKKSLQDIQQARTIQNAEMSPPPAHDKPLEQTATQSRDEVKAENNAKEVPKEEDSISRLLQAKKRAKKPG